MERGLVGRSDFGDRLPPEFATAQIHRGTYCEWVFNGLELWDSLRGQPHFNGRLFEVFPNPSSTIRHGPRADRKREEWSQEALESLLLQLPEVKWTQDLRDAVGAALTAKTTDLKLTGKIALPG